MTHTRVVIAVEGRDIGIGQVVEPGAIEWNEGEEYPITQDFNFHDVDAILGRARNIQREENGDITAEVPEGLVIRETNPANPDYGKPYVDFAAWANGVEFDLEALTVVKKGVLRAIGRVPGFREGSIKVVAANPGANLE